MMSIHDEEDDVEEVIVDEIDDDKDAEEAESSKEAKTWLIVRVAGERTLDRRLQKKYWNDYQKIFVELIEQGRNIW